MKQESDRSLVPRLRFPEFRDAGEWEKSELQEFSTIIRGASPRPQGDPKYYGGTIPRLMGKDVARDGKWVTPSIDFLTEEGAKLSRFCKKGTLTIICSGDVGVPSFLAIDACIHDGFLALIDLDYKLISEDFLYYCLSYLQQLFNDSATHGGIYINLTTTILKEFKVWHPSIKEQQEIAACLASIDDRIIQETQKLDALRVHKKGLMQQLFPAEDQTLPQLRFPEFRNADEWEKKKLSELFEFRNGLNADKEKYGKGHKYISVMDVISGKPITYNSIIDSVEITKKELDSFMVEYGDILFQRSSETQEEAGQANVYLDEDKPAIFGGFVIRGRKISEYIPLFMNALLASRRVRREISSHSAGSTRYNVSQETLSVIVVLVPDLNEQQKIADCLTSLDELITLQTQTIDALKLHKKGLMQQLFPSVDEVSE
jgi:restriction endonuclease S subunit